MQWDLFLRENNNLAHCKCKWKEDECILPSLIRCSLSVIATDSFSDLFFLRFFLAPSALVPYSSFCLNMINISHRMSLASKPFKAPYHTRRNTHRISRASTMHKHLMFKGHKPTAAAPLAQS